MCQMSIIETAIAAKAASVRLAAVSGEIKNKVLAAIAEALQKRRFPNAEKSFSHLPGKRTETSDLSHKKYICPQNGCDYYDFKLRAGQNLEPCPQHPNMELIPERNNS